MTTGTARGASATSVVLITTAVAVALAGCGTTDAPGAEPGAAATDTAAPSTTAPFDYAAGVRNCRVTQDGGTYYLAVASQTDHNFSACQGLPTVPGDAAALLDKPGVDRRCLLDDPRSVQQYDANVAVYSDTKRADLAAARSRCRTENGHNGG